MNFLLKFYRIVRTVCFFEFRVKIKSEISGLIWEEIL